MTDPAVPRRVALSPHFSEKNARDFISLSKKKRLADSVESAYATSEKYEKYAIAVHECARVVMAYPEVSRVEKKCRCRHCPICDAEKSAKNREKISSAIAKIHGTHPTARYLFLTLTVRNVEIDGLRETLKAMNESFSRLVRPLSFVLGWFRTTEVTRGTDGNAHPHFHAIVVVKPNYFSRKYMPQPEWADAWKKALRAEYVPRVDVRAVKTGNALVEVTKAARYSLKQETIDGDPAWFLAYHDQVSSLRFFAAGGILRAALAGLEADPSDDEETDGGDPGLSSPACFSWLSGRGEYTFDADMTDRIAFSSAIAEEP